MALRQGLLGFVLLNGPGARPPPRKSGASVVARVTGNASKLMDISACDGPGGSEARDGRRAGLELLQTHVSRLKGRGPHVVRTTQSPQVEKVLHVGGGILLLCFLLVLKFASTDILVGMAIFLDHFMTFGLLPFAPTVTPNYQHIAVLQSSKNVVACLLVPFVGKFIDGNEAKSVQLGLLCAMFCSLGFALAKNYAFWLAMRTLSGYSTAAIVWGGFALVNREYANDATARVQAVSTAMAGLYAGIFAGPQVAGMFVDDSRLMFLFLSGAQMCVCLTIRVRFGSDRSQLQALQEPMPKQTEVAKVDMLELLLDPEIRKPIVALFLGSAVEAAVSATTWEYMTSLGYDHVKQNLTWLMATVPGVISANLVPVLRSVLGGQTLQISTLLLGGASTLACLGTDYIFLALTLVGTSSTSGLLNGNTASTLADRSQEKYDGTGQVFVLSNTAEQVAFIAGPCVGSSLCRYASFQAMCHVIGACLVLYAGLLWWPDEGSKAKQTTTTSGTDPRSSVEAGD